MLLALFGLIALLLLIRVRRRGIILGLILIVFLFSSTEAFYRLLFVRSISTDNKDARCAVAVTDGSDIVEAATLVSSIRKLRIDNLYVLSIGPDSTLPAQLNQFFMNDQKLQFLSAADLNDERFRGCVYTYSPHLYCFVAGINRKYTLLPHDVFPYIPTARFMTINSETIAQCLSGIFR